MILLTFIPVKEFGKEVSLTCSFETAASNTHAFLRSYTMIWHLDTQWILMAFASVGILSFMLGLALDGIMGRDGFGAVLNAIIITTAFFGTIYICNMAGISLRRLEIAVPYGLTGAFGVYSFLALVKAGLSRMFGQ